MKDFLKSIFVCTAAITLLSSCAGIYRTGRPQGQGRGGGGGGGNHRPANPSANPTNNVMVFDNKSPLPANFSGKVIKNVQYATNTNYLGQTENLKLDILMPPQAVAGRKYPLFVFIHGGGFLVGAKNGAGVFRAGLAERGYVVASIDYRLGWSRADNRKGCSGDSLDLKYAVYRALQDFNAAVRFLVAHADEYQINPDWIFAGGQSAGGVTSLNGAFLSQDEANKDIPGVVNKLGYINSSGNNLTNTFKIKAVAAMWGDMHSPDQVGKNDAVPVVFFHGEQDHVAPVKQGNVYYCPNFMYVYGSETLYPKLKDLGVSTVAYIDPNGGHGVFSDNFRINTVDCFLQNVMNGTRQEGYYKNGESGCK